MSTEVTTGTGGDVHTSTPPQSPRATPNTPPGVVRKGLIPVRQWSRYERSDQSVRNDLSRAGFVDEEQTAES